MKNTFTPGPWRVIDHGDGFVGVQMNRAGGFCLSTYDKAEALPNARLIASSPDLLAALKALLQRAEDELADPEDVGEVSQAKAAIANAEGLASPDQEHP